MRSSARLISIWLEGDRIVLLFLTIHMLTTREKLVSRKIMIWRCTFEHASSVSFPWVNLAGEAWLGEKTIA